MVHVELTVLVLEKPSVWEADNVHWHAQVGEPVDLFLLVDHCVLLMDFVVVPVDGEHGWQNHSDLVLEDKGDKLKAVN